MQIRQAALAHEGALAGDELQQLDLGLGQLSYLVARLDPLRVGLEEVIGGEHGDVGVVEDGVLDGRCDGQPVATGGRVELGPEETRGIGQDDVVVQLDPLLGLGHPRLVAGPGDDAPRQGVDQGGLAHVGDAHDHGPHPAQVEVALRQHLVAQGQQRLDLLRLLLGQGQRLDPLLLFHVRHPQLGDRRIGEIRLVQHLDDGSIPTQLGHQGVLAGEGDAGIEHLDDDIDLGHDLGNFFAGLVHVAGEPVDGHIRYSLIGDAGSRWGLRAPGDAPNRWHSSQGGAFYLLRPRFDRPLWPRACMAATLVPPRPATAEARTTINNSLIQHNIYLSPSPYCHPDSLKVSSAPSRLRSGFTRSEPQ